PAVSRPGDAPAHQRPRVLSPRPVRVPPLPLRRHEGDPILEGGLERGLEGGGRPVASPRRSTPDRRSRAGRSIDPEPRRQAEQPLAAWTSCRRSGARTANLFPTENRMSPRALAALASDAVHRYPSSE